MRTEGWIYGLYDLRKPEIVRYVGQTRGRRGLADRIYHHKWDSRKRGGLPVREWIAQIGEDSLGYKVLATVHEDELNQEEVYWIAHYRSMGQADLNVLDGGTGLSTRHVEGEKNPKARMSWASVRELRDRASREYVVLSDECQKWGMTPAALSKVVLNQSWYDPEYDPNKRITISKNNASAADNLVWRTLTNQDVEDMRAAYLSEVTVVDIMRRWSQPRTSVTRALFEKYGSDDTRAQCVEKRGVVTRPNRMSEFHKSEAIRLRATGMSHTKIAKELGFTQTAVSYFFRQID